jgi:hypothetical protein
MSIGLVFDTSAVVAYASGSVHVGEPITQVVENGRSFGITALSLAAAAQSIDPAWLHMLVKHEAYACLPVEDRHWPAPAATYGLLGHWEVAAATEAAHLCLCDQRSVWS